jgi:hypothetical protein
MAYSTDIADLLAAQLQKFVTLNRHQLAGQVANLDFWLAEVRHCLDVIDRYPERFARLSSAQEQHVTRHGTVEFDLTDREFQYRASPAQRVPAQAMQKSRRGLVQVTRQLLQRCVKEGFLTDDAARRALEGLGIDVVERR